jgi:hypothetical protein
LGRDAPDGQDDLRLNQFDLPFQVRPAGCRLATRPTARMIFG